MAKVKVIKPFVHNGVLFETGDRDVEASLIPKLEKLQCVQSKKRATQSPEDKD